MEDNETLYCYKTEENKTELYGKLLNIQSELKCNKSQYNSFGKYNYRSCEDILEAVKPLCLKYGVVLQVSDTLELIGNRFYIKARARLTDINDGKCMENIAYAREEEEKKGMDGSQITGTASSYARKYALNGLFCIDDTKDADTDEFTERTERNAPVEAKPTYANPLEEAKAFTFQGGKHVGETIMQVAEEDSQYLNWYYTQSTTSAVIKEYIKLISEEMKKGRE